MESKKFDNLEAKFPHSYTYNDILMIPQYTEIQSRSECIVKSKFSKNIPLLVPLVSSPMDTVTEHNMAIGMARNGGIGVIHRFMSISDQVKMVKKVKRAENFIIQEPYLVDQNESIDKLMDIKRDLGIQSFLVTDIPTERNMSLDELEFMKNLDYNHQAFSKRNLDSNKDMKLQGIITARDLKAWNKKGQTVKDLMTTREKLQLYVKKKDEKLQDIDKLTLYDMMVQRRLEKLPIVDDQNNIIGLVTEKDLHRIKNENLSNVNEDGKLYVSCAIGCKDDYIDRAQALVNVGCDSLVIDVANGHNKMTIDTVAEMKDYFKGQRVDIIAGNVATGDGARRLIEAGADSIRCGIGNGSICITRIVSGSGVPQLSALLSCAPVCNEHNIPLISDGGNKNSGNMCKALGLGADCLMMGRLIAGTDESPGSPFLKDGKFMKIHRGMAGYGANLSKAQRMNAKVPDSIKFSAEGVEGYVHYSGSLSDVLLKFVLGIKSGMSYMGARNIQELRQKVSVIESRVHGIQKY